MLRKKQGNKYVLASYHVKFILVNLNKLINEKHAEKCFQTRFKDSFEGQNLSQNVISIRS